MKDKKKILFNVFIFLFYFIYQLLCILVVDLLKIDLNNNYEKCIYLLITNIIYLIFLIFVYRKELKDDISKLKLKSIIKYIPIYIIGILLMWISSYIISNITGIETSQNESLVRQYIKILPIYMSFSTVIYAPIVEEITFRKTFRNVIKDNILFVILSGLVFGSVHISITSNSFNDFLMIIPYIIMGIDFSYIYYKSNNIFTTITLHSVHNLILLIVQFIGG
ncbi:MAG: CPBP family intramembrane metalloprotease [Bacilli bacterium]|nr:CPBP family intramembrane metalloprotease [Bacilli bacterium]